MPEISVIIPTYGEPEFLEKAINSVINQTYKDFELIVVDDNDPMSVAREKTEKILAEFDNIIYLKHEKNMNGAVARNTGIKAACGKYIAFLDSDDEFLPTRLAKCHAVMENSDPTVAGVYTGCEFRRGGKKYNVFNDPQKGDHLVETLACSFMFCTGSNLFVRASVVKELDGFDGSFIRHQDYEFLVRVFEKYSLEAIKEVLVIKNNENVNLPNVGKMIGVKKQYLDKYSKIIDGLSDADKRYIYGTQYVSVAEAALQAKDKKTADEYYRKAKKYRNLSFKEFLRKIIFSFKS